MATKTISLELDAYEKLKAAKRGRESFSSVVRRCVVPGKAKTGKDVLEYYRARESFLSEKTLKSIEEVDENDLPPTSPWDEEL